MSPLPESAQALIGLIGLAETILLVKAYGGISPRTPLDYAEQREFLAQVVSEKAAETLCAAHAGRGKWYIPRCLALLNAERDRAIRAEYDAGLTIDQLVLKYRKSARHISTLLKKPETLIAFLQADLFAA